MAIEFDDLFEDLPSNQVTEKQIKLDGTAKENTIYSNVKKVSIDDSAKRYFVKRGETPRTMASIASANMYNQIGITTPPIALLKHEMFSDAGTTKTIQADVKGLPNIEATLALEDFEYSRIAFSFVEKYKWQIFYDSNLQIRFLKFMTKDCLESLQNVFLIDELRTDSDRHTKNYFLYKRKGGKLYEGVIVIDLEEMKLYNFCGNSKDSFNDFLAMSYESVTPQQRGDYAPYLQRLKDIRELIDDGVLSAKNIETLKKALEFDLPKQTKLICKKRKLPIKLKNATVAPIERLWELNQTTIGKDLGL